MIDAKFAKIPKIWVQFVIKNDVEIFLFCQKNYAKKKLPIFLLQLLSLPLLESVCFLKKRDRNIFTLKSFILLITKNMWQTCFRGSFHEENGPASVPHGVGGGPKEEPYMKALCKLQNAPKCSFSLLAQCRLRYI